MANNKFFTNTYNTGGGRQNYLRIDHLEDPLFTSFTFDIDFTSSPLFYTLNNYDYPNSEGLSDKIETALKSMHGKLNPDQGYDILPLMSADFFDKDKFGFGLQQNVYTDLPLYGATEYIYMVDKRNGDGSQNDVRYHGGSANSGGNTTEYNSYKLGDSVKKAVSESDKIWAKNKNAQAEAVIRNCDEIMAEGGEAYIEHSTNKDNMDKCKDAYKEKKVKVQGVDGEFTEEELRKKVKELKQFDNAFEQLKKDIANWVNGELSAVQSRMTTLYEQNECVKQLMSYDKFSEKYIADLVKKYGDDDYYIEKYIWDESKLNSSDESNLYLNKSIEIYNNLKTYHRKRNFFGDENKYFKDDDDPKYNQSLLVEKVSNEVCVRSSKIVSQFKDKLKIFGLIDEEENFNYDIKVTPSKEAPEWTNELADRISTILFDSGMKDLIDTVIVTPLRYKCDAESDFDNLDSETYTKNYEKLGRYENALDQIMSDIYGVSSTGEICDEFNPSPDSLYGQYLAAKEKYENDAYSQAEKTKSIAQSGMVDIPAVPDSEKSDLNNNTNSLVPSTIQQSSSGTQTETIVTPQTVLDMLGFISGMKKMTTEYPYIINGVTGLDKAYENHYGVKDPYLGSGDNKIVLSCWESLDLRVSSMFNRYFNAVYDRQYRRERVPVNLRRFNCSIYVHDVRHFVNNSADDKYVNRILELTNMYYSVIEFKFYDCEIVPEETGNIFNDISNESPSEMKKTNFTFTYGNCVVNFVPQSEVTTYNK